MTRLDADPAEAAEAPVATPPPLAADASSGASGRVGPGPRAVLLEAREVPLGGVRGMSVHRALPQRDLPMVGAWCFLDRFGPQDTVMRVEPHPHIGLQTVTWPLVGEVRHRDAVGSDVVVRRGVLNLMTSGEGIAHSEYSVGDGPIPLDALQLWVALPESRRHGEPAFAQHADLPVVALEAAAGAAPGEATVVLGALGAVRSPASAHTPIVGAELRIPTGSRVVVPLDPAWEHAVVGIRGDVVVHAHPSVTTGPQHLVYLGDGRTTIELDASEASTVFLLGGEPFPDEIVMWWNFVGRSHEEIVEAREAWEAGSPRFGRVTGHGEERIPAPPLPAVRLRPRSRRL